jgi:hypothetical protein
MKKTQVALLLAYVTGMVNQQLLLQNEYLIAENRILRSHLPAQVRLTHPVMSGNSAHHQLQQLAKPSHATLPGSCERSNQNSRPSFEFSDITGSTVLSFGVRAISSVQGRVLLRM